MFEKTNGRSVLKRQLTSWQACVRGRLGVGRLLGPEWQLGHHLQGSKSGRGGNAQDVDAQLHFSSM
jgi:hypothetical protein